MTFLTHSNFFLSRNAFSIYILLLFLITFILSRFQGHNGDMPFYIVCVIEKESGSLDGVITQTKDVLQKELPASEYQVHAARLGDADPVILESYRINPLYILLVLIFHKSGFSYDAGDMKKEGIAGT